MKNASPEVREAIEALQRLTELFSERRRQLASEASITEAQWQVLEEIDGEAFLPSMFARSRSVAPAAVSRTLRQLLERDLVRVSVGEADGRQRVYRLTAPGKRLLGRLHDRRGEAIEAIWKPLRRDELRAFTRFAGELSARLDSYLEGGG